jgi:hypothetical protein
MGEKQKETSTIKRILRQIMLCLPHKRVGRVRLTNVSLLPYRRFTLKGRANFDEETNQGRGCNVGSRYSQF